MTKIIHTQLTRVGVAGKGRGVDGTFKVRIEDLYHEDATKAKAIFIDRNGSLAPYLIESIQMGRPMLLKVEGIDDPESAEKFSGASLYFHSSDISEKVSEEKPLHPYVTKTLMTGDGKVIGVIEDIIEYPQQLLAKLKLGSREVLIPIHDDLVININEEEGVLTVKVADGLLDL